MTNTEILKVAFKDFAGLSEEAFDLSSNFWHEKSFKKGELFNDYRNVCKELGFIIEGIFRSYIIDYKSGEDKNIFFFSQNGFVTAYKSFVRQIPCEYYTEALTDAHIVCINIFDLQNLYRQSHEWEHFDAPAYPGHEGTPSELRENAPDSLGYVTFTDVVNKMEAFIETLPEKPIIVGHSMGGLVAQKLIEKDLAEAAVIISSAPPKGVMTLKVSFAKANLGLLNPFKGNSIHYPTKKWFHYAFTNTLSREESDSIFDKFVIPESRKIPRETLKKAGKIDFKKPHAPMLFISGKEDHIIPASLNKKNFKRYKDEKSKREHKIYEGRDHFIAAEDGWEEVANYVYSWIK